MADKRVILESVDGNDDLFPETRLDTLFDKNGNYINDQITAADVNQLVGKKVINTDAQTLTEIEKAVIREKINAAAPDGYYGESGGVFQYATNFLGKNSPQNASNVVFRPTASNFSGSGWSADSISGQTATIEKIKGKTLVFNQLVNKEELASSPDGDLLKTSQYMYNRNMVFPKGKYMVSVNIQPKGVSNHQLVFLDTSTLSVTPIYSELTGNRKVDNIITLTSDCFLGLRWSGIPSSEQFRKFFSESGALDKGIINFHNLTQMFGSGREPQTVGEFKAQFPLDYYAYNTGELISLNATGLKTNGFNQWDEEWELGGIGTGNGIPYSSSTSIRAKNFCDCLPSVGYYFKCPTSVDYGVIYFYDTEYNYITFSGAKNQTVISPSNARYFKIAMTAQYGVVYNHDICINISWSGVRDGDYEPAWNSELSLPIADYFPEGMKSADTVYDELTKDKAVKRIGVVDLSTLSWSFNTSINCWICSRPSDMGSTDKTTAVCDTYSMAVADSETTQNVNTIAINGTANIWCNTGSSSTRPTGHLFYMLKEPVETQINPPLNLTYRCDDFGTEMLLPQNSDEPITAPMDAEIVYQLDYEADIRNNNSLNITKESMDNFVNAFNASGLGSMTQVWDPVNKKYTYTMAKDANIVNDVRYNSVPQTIRNGAVNILNTQPVRLGFRIKQSESNPSTRVEYLYDAVGMIPAHMDYSNGAFDFGSWNDVWFVKDNFPAMFKSDGSLDYELDPSDYTKKLDGTASDIANTEYDGNAMSCIPLVWVKRWTDAEYRYIVFSSQQIDSSYHAKAHEMIDGNIAPYAVGPMFKGSLLDGKLRSLSGQRPQSSTTAAQELSYAQANDGLGTNSKWGIRNHFFDDLIFDLLILISKSTDVQNCFGQGHSSAGVSAADLLDTGTLKDKGQFFGYSSTDKAMKVFHMENFYAERWDRQEGMICNNGKAMVAEHTADFNFDGTGYKDINVTFAATEGYVKERITNEYGSFASVVGGSSTTFDCDYHYISTSGVRVPLVGGHCKHGAKCGRYVHVYYAASSVAWNLGASPFLKQPSFN